MKDGRDITETFPNKERELEEIFRQKKAQFYKTESLHEINEKYVMYRSGSRVCLVSAEKEKNSHGEGVNKDLGFEYALPSLYLDDYLDEFFASLQE